MNHNTSSPEMMTTFQGTFPLFPKAPLPHWAGAARDKGFDIAGRICDRLHVALRCRDCGMLNKTRIFTLMSAQPLCHACIESTHRENAANVDHDYLQRDNDHRHYAIYRAPCGHEVRRQFELVKRVAAGKTGIRCDICHAEIEAAEARARGWALIGPDPDGDPNYRLYRHDDCQHEQRIARANMQTGRLACGGCSKAWPAAGSYIYVMAFTLATGRDVVKVGFSRDPESRLAYQLQRDPEMPCSLVRKMPIVSGQRAIRAEKGVHRTLKTDHPESIVHRSAWNGQIRVKSEIYDAALLPVITRLLDEIETHDPDA